MGSYQFPAGPGIASPELARALSATGGDRRAFLRRAAGLGLAVPALGLLGREAQAQEGGTPPAGHDMGEEVPEGYVGSDPESPGTGDESPVQMTPQPYVLYDPVLPRVEAGPKEITITAKDAALYVAKDVPYAAWTFDGTVPGRALRVVEGDEIKGVVKTQGFGSFPMKGVRA